MFSSTHTGWSLLLLWGSGLLASLVGPHSMLPLILDQRLDVWLEKYKSREMKWERIDNQRSQSTKKRKKTKKMSSPPSAPPPPSIRSLAGLTYKEQPNKECKLSTTMHKLSYEASENNSRILERICFPKSRTKIL